MDLNDFNSFDDFLKFCREYVNMDNDENNNGSDEDNSCNECRFGNSNANASESARKAFSDIPGGFQDINPQLFTIVTTILGTVVANNLPFNIQNSIGNWLELLGQSIITFNAQQQYFQGGPGRVYSPIYRNSANPFCSSSTDESQSNVASNGSNGKKNNSTNKTKNNEKQESNNGEIEELKNQIINLNNKIEELKREIEKLKNKM